MKKFLVIADQFIQDEEVESESPLQPAFQKALELSQSREASIEVVSFCYESLYSVEQDYQHSKKQEHSDLKQLLIDHTQKEWDEYFTTQNSPDNVTHKVVWEKYIHLWILEQCKQEHYDLVIKTGHRSESWYYTPTDWQLFRESTTPIYSVNTIDSKTKNSVLVSLDLLCKTKEKQSKNETLLEKATDLAAMTSSELHVCCALEIPTLIKDFDLVDVTARTHQLEDQARDAAKPILERYGIAPKNLHLREGKSWNVINHFARKNKVQCIVIGSMGRKGVKGKLIGNTAERVIQNARCDLLVI